MKLVIEIEVTDEDLQAGHFVSMFNQDDGEKMSPEDLAMWHLKPAILAKLNRLRSKRAWELGRLAEHPNLAKEEIMVGYPPEPTGEYRPQHIRAPIQGGQKCPKSPTGHCWYDDSDDPAWDFCVFCEEPDERK